MNKEYDIKNFQPLHDNIIVKPIKILQKEVIAKDGKAIKFARPQQEEDKSELGEVIAIGGEVGVVAMPPIPHPLVTEFPFEHPIKVGDIVLYNKYSTTKTDLGEELVVRYEDIVAVLKHNE